MLAILHLLGTFVVNLFKSRRRLEIENLFLRHQLNIVLRRAPHRLRLRANDRALLVWMTWLWQASDFQEPYLRHLLGFIGITEVIFIHAEKTAFGPDGPVRPPSRPRRRASRPPGSAAIFGRPPREQDFQRQYRRKPARCQRTRVSGRMIVMALRTDGNHRYSWTKNKRSPFVSRTRPRILRCSTIN
jgi:hypothetical protein